MNQSSLIKTHPLLKISEDTIYSNYQTLKKKQTQRTFYTTNHRTITIYNHEIIYKVERLMSLKKE